MLVSPSRTALNPKPHAGALRVAFINFLHFGVSSVFSWREFEYSSFGIPKWKSAAAKLIVISYCSSVCEIVIFFW